MSTVLSITRRRSQIVPAFAILALLLACEISGGKASGPENPQPSAGPQVAAGPAQPAAPASKLTEEKRAQLIQAAMASIPPAVEGEDKSLSPYFFVLSDDPKTDQLPLKATGAQVDIAGVIANVKVTQVYKNDGKNTLEAIYIFPASTRAAVYAMRMTIADRVIEAKIREREQARKEYEQARAEGKTASLLEQQRPNVFQMNVANILPGDEIKVEMFYTELLVPENNVYEFVYPTVVGPRYSNQTEATAGATDKFTKTPTLPAGSDVPYTFTLSAKIRSGLPIAKVTSPSHPIEIEKDGEKTAIVALKDLKNAGNRDFVLRYQLAGKKIESGLLLFPGEEENFFLLMMEPPERIEPKELVRREYIFIIDVSGSQEGFPLSITKELMRNIFKGLRPTDFFNVMLFSGGDTVLSEKSLPATPANLEKAIRVIDNQQGGGGTEIVLALKHALALPRTEGTSRIVVISTDGYVSVEKECFELIRAHLGEANLFAFGIGSSVNRFIIEGMARAGLGEPFVVLNPGQAKGKADRFLKYISSPLMQGIKVEFKGLDAYDVEPQAIPDLFADKPVVVFGKYRGQPQGAIVVHGHVPGQELAGSMPLAEANLSPENKALRYLWARHRIMTLADLNQLDKTDARVKQVTELGLKYSLMTEFTSFVAIDSLVRANGKDSVTVKQPLPMPEGVSNAAVGGIMPSPSVAAPMGRAMPMHAMGGMAKTEEAEKIAPPPKRPAEKPVPEVKVAAAGQVTLGKPTIRGSLGADAIQRVLSARQVAMQRCYAAELAKAPGLSGSLQVQLQIGTDGKVTAVKVTSSSLKNASLEACISSLLKALLFPTPAGGGIVIVDLSLTFNP